MTETAHQPPADATPPSAREAYRVGIGTGLDPLVSLGPGWQVAENHRLADLLIVEQDHDREELRYLRRERPLTPVIFIGPDADHTEFSARDMGPLNLGPVQAKAREILDRIGHLERSAIPDIDDNPHLLLLAFVWSRGGRAQVRIAPGFRSGYGYDCEHVFYDEDGSPNGHSLLPLLTNSGYFSRELAEVAHPCPQCASIQILMRDGCAACGSVRIEEVSLLHHFSCAYQAAETEFTAADGAYICPKCRKELRHFGLDYDKPGLVTVCTSCGHEGTESQVRGRCITCGHRFAADGSPRTELYDHVLTDVGVHALFSGNARVRSTAALLGESLSLLAIETFTAMAAQMDAISKRHGLDCLVASINLRGAKRSAENVAAEIQLFYRLGAEIAQIVRPTDAVTYDMGTVYLLLPGNNADNIPALEKRFRAALRHVFDDETVDSLALRYETVREFVARDPGGTV